MNLEANDVAICLPPLPVGIPTFNLQPSARPEFDRMMKRSAPPPRKLTADETKTLADRSAMMQRHFPELCSTSIRVAETLERLGSEPLMKFGPHSWATVKRWLSVRANRDWKYGGEADRIGLRHYFETRPPELRAEMAGLIEAGKVRVEPARESRNVIALLGGGRERSVKEATVARRRGTLADALRLLDEGHTVTSIASTVGIPRSTLYANHRFTQAIAARKLRSSHLPHGSKDKDGNVEAEAP